MTERSSQNPLAKYKLGRTALDLQTFTVSDLKSLTGISDNTIYSFLANLCPDHIRSENISGTGRGRPRKRYSLTRSGNEALIDQNVEATRLLRGNSKPLATRAEHSLPIPARRPAFEVQEAPENSPKPLAVASIAFGHQWLPAFGLNDAPMLPPISRAASPMAPNCSPEAWATEAEGVAAGAHIKTPWLVESRSASMARLQDITMSYNTASEPTFKELQLEVPRGEFVSICGPTGSGKSTLMSILGLIEEPNSGEYWLGGEPVTHLPKTQRTHVRNRQLGFVLQDLNLIGDRSVSENVEIPLLYAPVERSERQHLVQGALELVGMEHCAHHYPRQLTAGQQQRLAVARAMVGRPQFLLIDEPTAHLKVDEGKELFALLHSIHRQGTTICMATQDPEEARLAQRYYWIEAGQVHRKDPLSS